MTTDNPGPGEIKPPGGGRAKTFPAPPAIPDHTLLRRIGGGSYGDVWLARNSIGEYRAVKIVHRSSFSDQRPFERELSGIRKFEPVSRLHEGFVDILHVGVNEAEGCFYYIMELGDDCVAGRNFQPETYVAKTLASHIAAKGRLSVPECLELGCALARALQQLHAKNLVHRDIKPSNIIFVDGIPKLADIGLVTGVEDTLSYVGTEGFIPPEGPGAPPADIFSLGRVLYEAGTGKDRHYFPELPASLKDFPDPQAFLELNEIILRACNHNLRERYKTAAAMLSDLTVLLDGKSVRRLRQLERKLLLAKRAAAIGAIAAAAGLLIGYELYQRHEETIKSRQRQIGSMVAYGNRSLESGDLPGSTVFYAEALRLDHEAGADEAADRLRLGAVLAQCPKLTHLFSAGERLNNGDLSPDGQKVLLSYANGKVEVHELASGAKLGRFAQESVPETARFSHDARLIVTASGEHTAGLYDGVTFSNIALLQHPEHVMDAVFSPDDQKIATACRDGKIRIWDVKTGQCDGEMFHADRLRCVAFNHDGSIIASGGEDGQVRFWDAATRKMILKPLPHPSWVYVISFSPDDSQVVTACADHAARVWSTNGDLRYPILRHENVVWSTEFSPDGLWIVTACLDGSARLWRRDTQQPAELCPVLPNGERVRRATFSRDSRCIVVFGEHGGVRIWDLSGGTPLPPGMNSVVSADGRQLATLEGGKLAVHDAATWQPPSGAGKNTAANGGKRLLSLGQYALIGTTSGKSGGEEVEIAPTTSGQPAGCELHFDGPKRQFGLSEDGHWLAAFAGKTINLVDVTSKQPVTPDIVAQQVVKAVFFDAGARHLISSESNCVQVWNVPSGTECYPALAFSNWISMVALRSDGAQVIGSCWDDGSTPCYSQAWDFQTGKPVGPHLSHGDGVLWAGFSPNGERIGTASEDFTAMVWNALDGSQRTPPLRHHNRVETIAFSADGRWVVTASDDFTARIWNAETGDPMSPPLRHLRELRGARFLAGSTRVLTETYSDEKHLWNLAPDERPAEDIMAQARILAGSTVSRFGKFKSDQGETVEQAWERLRRKYPSAFETTEADAVAWHEWVAEECTVSREWQAAVFHLKWLLARSPEDASLKSRLATATAKLHPVSR